VVSVYVVATVCMVHGSCRQGWFLLKNPALFSCENVMPMIEGHRSRDRAGNTLIWHAKDCVTGKHPPDGEMLGMF
jgi:hypothetical protein